MNLAIVPTILKNIKFFCMLHVLKDLFFHGKLPGSKESSKSNPPSPIRSPCSSDNLSLINGDVGLANGPGALPASLAQLEDETQSSGTTKQFVLIFSFLSLSLLTVWAKLNSLHGVFLFQMTGSGCNSHGLVCQ